MRKNNGVIKEFIISLAVNCIIYMIRALFRLSDKMLFRLIKKARYLARKFGHRPALDQDLGDLEEAFGRDPAAARIIRKMVLEGRIPQMRWVVRGFLFYD